ncbi:MAG: sodium/proton-translocating pyrophosphatase, partial [Planctomycetota bacterium]
MTTTLLAAALGADDPLTRVLAAGIFAVIALIAAIVLSFKIKSWSAGNDDMRRLSRAIRKGAMAFLRTEYVILFFFVLVLGAALTIFVDAGGWDDFLWIVDHDQLGALLLGKQPVA